MREIYADLHIHTQESDGLLTLKELLKTAFNHPTVQVVAVTDHDRINYNIEEPVIRKNNITVIRGIELRVETEKQRIDLLGYGIKPTRKLEQELNKIQEGRKERARKMKRKVEEYTGVELDLSPDGSTGRPDIARSIERSNSKYDYNDAFEKIIGHNNPCYVKRYVPDFEKGFKILKDSASFVSLAHPFRYDNPWSAIEKASNLDGVETYYPYEKTNNKKLKNKIRNLDVLPTGGSDAHEKDIGKEGLEEKEFKNIISKSELCVPD